MSVSDIRSTRDRYVAACDSYRDERLSAAAHSRAGAQMVDQRHELDEGILSAIEELQADDRRSALRASAAEVAGVASTPAPRAWLPTIQEYRADLNETTDSQGGYLVAARQADAFFDLLRAQSCVLKAAPRILTMTGEVLNVPKILTSTTTGWFAEAAQLSSTEMTFEAVTLTAKKLAAYTELSNEVLSDSSPSVRDLIGHDFAAAMAAGLDLALLEGDGTGASPTGLRNFASVSETHMGTNGASVTLDAILAMIGRVEEADANPDTLAFFMHPRTWTDIKASKDDNGAYYIGRDPSQPAARRLFGVPVFTSSQISTTEEVGSSGAACSYIVLADMAQVAIGRRTEFNLRYSDQFKFDYDLTAVRAISRWDIAPVNVAAVDVLDGITS